jgi:hypothetical protein
MGDEWMNSNRICNIKRDLLVYVELRMAAKVGSSRYVKKKNPLAVEQGVPSMRNNT